MLNIRAVRRVMGTMTPAAAAAIGVLLITIIALFTSPFIGMADNGDYFRILYSNGIYFNDPDYTSKYLGYFVKDYGIYQYYNENGATLFSSQSMFIKAALFLNHLFHDSQTFDIRYQAAIYMVLYTAAVYLIVEAVTWKTSRKRGYVLAGIAVFIFGDTGYTAYFNSFYSESVVLIMSMFMFSAGLLLYRKRYNDYVMLALFVTSSVILTTSKQQNAPVGIIAAVFGIGFWFIRNTKWYQTITVIALTTMLAAGIGTYVLIPKEFVNINKYHAMTRGVLMNSPDPEKALESFGIDKQYAILNDSLYYDPYSTVDVNSKQLQDNFYDKYGFGSILVYYAAHPDQAAKMLNIAAQDGFTIRPKAMGNYEQQTGKPFGAQTYFFSGYSLLKDKLAPKTFGFVILWVLVTVGLYSPSFVTAFRTRLYRKTTRLPLLLMMMGMGVSGIIVSIIGAGDADIAKHEFLFNITFDMVSFAIVGDLLGRRLWSNEKDEETETKAKRLGGGGFAPTLDT
ncbi:glycan biosynthesis hexose transferase WsfD [Paenibacillus hexagrammi]|uniref:Transmembrane protein n=1 Tax=Paenibacillus hexagrammi TaxID=2908839 RepID=A0ABY3SRI2_9BACL|nr:hypothetical protein [Paenibacillus sp. YPD9-1]UJF36088.1 hypothetical protein L0M14_14035 [Paenibacillus sp. YPD9-1]